MRRMPRSSLTPCRTSSRPGLPWCVTGDRLSTPPPHGLGPPAEQDEQDDRRAALLVPGLAAPRPRLVAVIPPPGLPGRGPVVVLVVPVRGRTGDERLVAPPATGLLAPGRLSGVAARADGGK